MTQDRAGSFGRRGLGLQAVVLAGSTGVAQLVVAAMYVWAARSTDPTQYGLVVTAIALGTAGAGFVDFGANSLWVRELAGGRLTTRAYGFRYTGKLLAALVLASIWSIATFAITPSSQIWIAGPVAAAICINQASQVALRGNAQGEKVGASILTDRLVAAAVFAALSLAGFNPTDILWFALVVGSMAAATMGWVMTPRALRPRLGVSWRVNPWRGSSYYGVSVLSTSAQSLDLVLLASVGGATAAGIYGSVSRWTQPMGLLASAFASASAPFVARSTDSRVAWKAVRSGIWLPFCAVGLCVVVLIAAPFIVPFILGNSYTEASGVLQLLALVSIASILSQPLLVGLQSLGLDRFVAITMATVVLAQLILVGVMSASFGAWGAAAASLIAQIALLAALVVRVGHEYRHAGKQGGTPSND